MEIDRRYFIASSLFSAVAISLPVLAEADDTPSAETKTVSLRGRVVCLTEELKNLYQVIPDCETRGHVYALKDANGKFYPILPVDTAAAVWMDERYRQRELQVTGRLFPESSFIEIFRFQSWLKDKLHDLYYYCDVCSISAHKPGPCECCQAPVEFRETPSDSSSEH